MGWKRTASDAPFKTKVVNYAKENNNCAAVQLHLLVWLIKNKFGNGKKKKNCFVEGYAKN